MKISLSLLALVTMMGIYGCNRNKAEQETVRPNDTTIERQDEYRSEDLNRDDSSMNRPMDKDEVEVED